jgi:hypothetical protein
MISLILPTHKLQAVLAGAKTTNELQCSVYYYDVKRDAKQNQSMYIRFSKYIDTNGTTAVDICDVPPQDIGRHIETINIYNKDTVNATVSVQIDISGTKSILKKHVLTTGQTLIYEAGAGWLVL